MIKGIYAIRDILIGFHDPFIMVSDEVALRAFVNAACSDQPTIANENPADTALFKLAEFDTQSGEIHPCSLQMLCTSVEAIAKKERKNVQKPD